MLAKVQKIFALTRSGTYGLIKSICITIFVNMSLMFPALLMITVINNIFISLQKNQSYNISPLLYILIALLLFIILYILHWIQYKILYIETYTETANRRINLAEKLRKLPISFFGKKDLSDLTSTIMSDCSTLEQAFSHYIPQLFATCISTFILSISLICFNWKLGIAMTWVIPVSTLLILCSRWLQEKFGEKNIQSKRLVTENIQEILETIKDIKSCNRQILTINKLKDNVNKSEKSALRSELITGLFVTSSQAFLKLGIITTVIVGIHLYITNQITLFYFLIFIIIASRIYDPLNICFMNLAAIFHAFLRINRMKEIENYKTQTGSYEYSLSGYDITFSHVKFSYPDMGTILDDISFTAKQGEVTALVGPSGGGKSTAVKLAARFWDVTEGSITLGGVNISKIDPESLLQNYSIVFQDVILFHDTIMENIRLGRRNASDQEVLEAAKAAQCDKFVMKFPSGYNTIIGENGSTLSGGERQRISIARAILKNAPIVLLDEATASLDVENETAIQEALSKLIKNKTVIIIAHRMRTVMNTDKVIVLANGKIIEEGKPSELMKQSTFFRYMVNLQNENIQWELNKK